MRVEVALRPTRAGWSRGRAGRRLPRPWRRRGPACARSGVSGVVTAARSCSGSRSCAGRGGVAARGRRRGGARASRARRAAGSGRSGTARPSRGLPGGDAARTLGVRVTARAGGGRCRGSGWVADFAEVAAVGLEAGLDLAAAALASARSPGWSSGRRGCPTAGGRARGRPRGLRVPRPAGRRGRGATRPRAARAAWRLAEEVGAGAADVTAAAADAVRRAGPPRAGRRRRRRPRPRCGSSPRCRLSARWPGCSSASGPTACTPRPRRGPPRGGAHGGRVVVVADGARPGRSSGRTSGSRGDALAAVLVALALLAWPGRPVAAGRTAACRGQSHPRRRSTRPRPRSGLVAAALRGGSGRVEALEAVAGVDAGPRAGARRRRGRPPWGESAERRGRASVPAGAPPPSPGTRRTRPVRHRPGCSPRPRPGCARRRASARGRASTDRGVARAPARAVLPSGLRGHHVRSRWSSASSDGLAP